ncbi:hypothetical protein AAF712_011392 [Marasmius tenuissimus]|uniref:Uncharacterized protein n=1 Tax=Marasmius tenuissimus TaxID=585030 RepID=A0ABR2ZJG9_9AGAR
MEFVPGVVQVFDSVILPSLKKLSVGFEDRKDTANFGNYDGKLPFEDFLQRSHCRLTHFEISSPRIVTAEKLINVLRQLENLVSLNLGYSRPKESEGGDLVTGGWGWGNPIVSPAWKRDWLERILREFLPPGSDVESETPTLTLCPQLEELNLGGCGFEDADVLFDFATKTTSRGAKLRVFRADLGLVLRGDAWKIVKSLRVQRRDFEEMRVVRDMGGMMFDCRWEEQEEMKQVHDTPTIHLPNEGIRWEESLWW